MQTSLRKRNGFFIASKVLSNTEREKEAHKNHKHIKSHSRPPINLPSPIVGYLISLFTIKHKNISFHMFSRNMRHLQVFLQRVEDSDDSSSSSTKVNYGLSAWEMTLRWTDLKIAASEKKRSPNVHHVRKILSNLFFINVFPIYLYTRLKIT